MSEYRDHAIIDGVGVCMMACQRCRQATPMPSIMSFLPTCEQCWRVRLEEAQAEILALRARLVLADKLAKAAKEFLRRVGRNINSHEDLRAYNRAHASLRETTEAYRASAGEVSGG